MKLEFFLCLSFLKQPIESTVPKAYWTEKIQAGSTLKYGYTKTMVLAKNLLVKMVLWLVALISFPQLKQGYQRRHI